MGVTVSVEEVAIFEGFGAKEVVEQDATLLQAGIRPEEQDVKIREFLNINGATAALIRMIATLIHEKTTEQSNELNKAQYMLSIVKDKNEIKQLQNHIEMLTQQYNQDMAAMQDQVMKLEVSLQQVTTEKNTLTNAIGSEKAVMLTHEIGSFESKEHYEELNESDCASVTKNEESDDESMADSFVDRFRELKIPQSLKVLGKRQIEKEPIENALTSETGNSLKDSIHATKKKENHEGKQSFSKHVLGVNIATCGVNKEELTQMIKDDMISSNVNFEQIKEVFANHNNHMTVTVATLQEANKIMMTKYNRQYTYVKLYELNQTIGHTKIILKNIPKHVTKQMLTTAIKENIGNTGELIYKVNKYSTDVETTVKVQIADKKFKELWSIPCNGYRIEVHQTQIISDQALRARNNFMAKIVNIAPNTTEQQLVQDMLARHAKFWKLNNVSNTEMEATVHFATFTDRSLAMSKLLKVKGKECNWIMINKGTNTMRIVHERGQPNRQRLCTICGKNNHVTQECFFRQREVRVYCTICKRNGHTNQECYFRNRNGRRTRVDSRIGSHQNGSSYQNVSSEAREYDNYSERRQFFRTGSNRIPITTPRYVNRETDRYNKGQTSSSAKDKRNFNYNSNRYDERGYRNTYNSARRY
ncbi:hypothetical protein C1645_746104 [Glomus cerebriforme]|uniref:CCHC-type domain-containing protein n=1 Tax=Glomus cerebriforme TaxID=658196 RepID=A0A397S0S3_9GLOM|nr:hypothetical protein C1645_746104 [Glomus cerebriforme]